MEAIAPLNEETTLFAGFDYRQRLDFQEESFDFARFDARVGLQFASGRNLYRTAVTYGRYYLDHRYNYDSTGISFEWRPGPPR